MELARIGNHLPHEDATAWETAQNDESLTYAYNEDTGMEYEYMDDFPGTGILAAWHEDVGQVTYYRATHAQWLDIVGTIGDEDI